MSDPSGSVGIAAADLMETLDKEFPSGYSLGTVALVVEVNYIDEDEDKANTILVASDEKRGWARKAFLSAAADMHPGLSGIVGIGDEE